MIDKCEICGTPTILMDPSGRREKNCDCEDVSRGVLCGCECGKRIDLNGYDVSKVYGPMRPECFERYQKELKLGLDSEGN